jgi:quinol monooxygenase YgiN
MITNLFKVQVVPGKEGEVEQAFRAMVAAVRANEAGLVITYSLHRLDSDPTTFMFYEQFADDAAIAAHGKSDHMAALSAALKGNLAGRPVSERYTKLAGIE